jgi:hypothetical protein
LSSAADPVFRIQRGTGSYSEISSDSNGTLFLRADEGNTTSSSNIRFEVDNTEHMRLDEYGQLILQSNPSTLFLGGTSTGSLVKGTSTGNYLIFGTSGSEAARFVGSNFGIGTTSPSRKLEVVDNGDILQITGTAGNAFARFTDNDASSDFSIGADDNSGAGAGAFMVYDRNNNAYRMIINSSGNVGIGVTNPSNKFQVADSAGGSIASFTNTTSADLSINLTSGVSLISPSTGILALGTSNTERMRIENNSIRFATDEVTPTGSGKDLGSPTYQWRDLFLSGTMVGGYRISMNNTNGGIFFGTTGTNGGGGFGDNGAIARAASTGYHTGGSQVGDLVIASERQKDLHFSTSSSSSGGVTTRMKIDQLGRVTKPYQPCFNVGLSNDFTPSGTFQVLPFNDTSAEGKHNIGGHYATSGGNHGKFIAPVAGRYFFHTLVLFANVPNGTDMNDSFYIKKNGVTVAFSHRRAYGSNGTTMSTNYFADHSSTILNLGAGDYVQIVLKYSRKVHGNQFYSYFSGNLIG